MGIVNVTPDSFYPGSRAPLTDQAVAMALRLAEEGADVLDLGGQSTRPGSAPVSEREELGRVLPVLEALEGRLKIPVSIDTDKAAVARAALAAGASIVNDVSALRGDGDMARVCLKAEAVILMHRGGDSPKTMQDAPAYGDVVAEVRAFLAQRLEAFAAAGGDLARVLIDPGIGFGKTREHNLSLLKHLDELTRLAPVVLGVSRKSFLGGDVSERLEGSLAVACWAGLQGVKVLRVHDAAATRRALAALEAVRSAA